MLDANNPFKQLKDKANFVVLLETTDKKDYEKNRIISNSRFDHKPGAIAFPTNAEEVGVCLKYCKKPDPIPDLKFKIRSGGHHHEGMCSGKGVLMIHMKDLLFKNSSEDNRTEFTEIVAGNKEVWVVAGANFYQIEKDLIQKGYTISGGGCKSVGVGGYALGGGWGFSCRKHGLGSHNFTDAEVVDKDGNVTYARDDKDLLKCLQGGGGGNFGVVTKYKFKLHKIESGLLKFSLSFDRTGMESVVKKWIDQQDKDDKDMTSFLRIMTDIPENPKPDTQLNPRKESEILITGMFYGPFKSHLNFLNPYLELDSLNKIDVTTIYKRGDTDLMSNYDLAMEEITSLYQPSIISTQDSETTGTEKAENQNWGAFPKEAKTDICGSSSQGKYDPVANKVSSFFPTDNADSAAIAKGITSYFNDLNKDNTSVHGSYDYKDAIAFLLLLGMGGKVKDTHPTDSAFPWTQKGFVAKPQAWWLKKIYPGVEDAKLADWVSGFRYHLNRSNDKPLVEGGFINFADKDLSPQDYFGVNLKEMKRLKKKFNPKNFFDSGMDVEK